MNIPQEDLKLFKTPQGRCKLMEKYGDSQTAFIGENVDGEMVMTSISHESIVIETHQSNGWVRQDWYDSNGDYEAEMYKGRWR